MKTKSLWKRIFGQPDKKVRAQAAFQEQFETKLQFRELEPRVVLDATALYNTDTGSLTIDIGDGETIDVGSTGAGSLFLNGLDGFKVTDGVTTTEIPLDGTAVGGVSFDAGVYTLSGISGLGQLTVLDSNDGSATSSKLQFLSLNEFGTLTITGNVFFQNVDNITFNNEANLSVTGSVHFIADSNADDTQVEIGSQISAVQVHVHNTGSPDFDFNMVSHADSELTALALTIYSNGGATSTVGIDLSKGLHYLDGIGMPMASGNDWISINEADGLALSELSLSSLTVVSGGTISDPTNTSIMVSGLTHLTATDIQLGASVGNSHDFNQLTLNASGNVEIHDATDGFDLVGTSEIGGSLALFAAGAVNQTSGTLAVDGTTEVMVSGGALVSLNQSGNELGGAVSVNSGTARAGLVHISDSTGDLVLGDIHATDLIADSQGAILQDAAGLDILQTTALVAGDGSKITLNSSNNVLDGSISAKGQTGAAGAVTIHNTMATALASVHGATLAVHSAGTIQQQSGIIQAGTANFHAATGAAITLDKLNQIGTILAEGTSGNAAGDVVIMNNGSLALDTIHANSLTVTLQNAGDLSNTATADITVSGLTTLTATNIHLGENPGNAHDFGTVTLTAAGNATLLDSSGDLTFVGDSHVGGNLVAAASAGSVLQSGGKLEIDGTSHFTAKSGAFVTLDESDNVFGGSLSASVGATGTVTIATGSDLKLGTIATGTFAATATNSNITDTFGQSITVASLATLSGKSVVLGEPGHDLHEVTLTATASSEIVETNGFIFVGNSTVGDDLTVTSGGAIQDTVTTKISVADEAWFTGGSILLNQSNDKHAFANLRLTTAGVADIVEFDGFSFFGNTSVGNNLSVASGGAILQSDGKIAVVGESAFHAAGAISLTSLLNDFNSNGDAIGSVSATGTAVDLVDTNSIILGDIDAQSLSVTASAGSITQTGPADKIVVATNSQFTATGEIQLSNATNDFTGAINATGMAIELADANSVLLGDIDAQNLSVAAVAGSITQTGPADKILVANESHFTATGAITLANITNDFTGSVSATGTAIDLVDANSILLGDIGAQSLSVAAAAGSITQTGPADKILVANESHFTATGAITLANITNDFTGSVSATGTAVGLVDTNSIILGDIGAQSLSVTASAGSITQTGPGDKILVANESHFTATGAITLANITNDFTGPVSAAGAAVELVDANSILLGNINAQSLSATATAGSITQTGPADKIAVATTSHFTATGAITLANIANDFTGSVSATGTAVELVDANSIILGDIDVQSLAVTAAAGSITQTGPADKIAVANISHFTATGAIILANNTNDFTGSVSAAGAAVDLVDTNSIILGDIDAQSLVVTAAAGSITQTAPADNILVVNESKFTATGEILLGNATNDFMGFVNATGTAIQLSDANSIILGNINAQSLSVTATAGSITQTGPADKILVANESHFTATGAITLANITNDFTGSVSATGTAVELVDANSILLGNIDAQSLAVTAVAGTISQAGPMEKILVADNSLFVASNAITLLNSGNDFNDNGDAIGSMSASGTAVQIRDVNSIILGAIDAESLKVTASAGSITQTGPVDKILVASNSQFTATGAITLLNSTNDFNDDGDGNGSVAATGTDVAIRDVNSIILGEISAASFQVVAGGDVTQLSSGEKLTVAGKTDIRLTGVGSVDLQYGANKLSNTVTLKLDDIDHLQNFHLRNEDASATTPSGDLAEALAIGNVNNLSFIFPVAGSLVLAEDPDGGGFDEIDILGDLYVELDGSLTQKGSIYVDGSAHFQAETINLAQTGNLDVDFDASFKATGGTIQVGVTTEAPEAFVRGTDSGQSVNFGTLNFEANGSHVTIAEDSKIDLVGQNKAKSLVLVSTTAGISGSAATSLTVSDLAAFKADVGDIILQQGVDLRIVYASATGNVVIIDSSLSDGLNIVDGTTANGGTLAIESNGHILQVNDFRNGAPVNAQIVADSAIFHSDKSVLLTDLKVSHLAGTAGGTINVSVNEAEIVSNALVNEEDGFGKILKIDAIDPLLPVAAGDPFAPQGPNPAGAISGAYSFVAVNNGSLTIENVVGVGGVSDHLGIKTEGQNTGHVFLRAKGAGANVDFKGSAGKETVIDLANSGILTALAEGELSVAANTELISRTGNVDGIVREIYKFEEQVNSGNNPELGGGFGIVDDISFGPTYIRELASKDADHQDPNTTLFLRIVNGIDTKANVTLTQLGVDGEQDLQVTVNWGDETETFLFSDAIANEKLSHFFSDDFLALNPVFTVTVTAYNSPLINLYENVESGNGSPRSLNVIQDQILMKVIIAEIWVPEVTEFVPPTNPIPQMAPIVTYTVSQVTTQVEFTDDTRVATPIDGVSVVEVNRNDPDMAIGDEVQLGDEFMTLDAVKEQIQRDERFRPGLYRITILYPGVETPQVFLFEKQIRATPIDIFGNSTPRQPQQPQIDQVAEASQNATTAEEVWAREYEKWFPTVAIEYAGEDNLPERPEGLLPADDRQGRNPSDADVLLERVSLLDLQEIDRLSERLRAQRSIVRDSLNGALVGGAALMAAAAAQRRRDDVHFMAGEEPPHEVRGGSLERLRRRLKQWL